MTSIRTWIWHRKAVAVVLMGALAVSLPLGLASCKSGGSPSGGGGPSPGGPLTGAILLQTDITVSQPVSIFYQTPNTAENIRAFRVAASSSDGLTAVEVGDEVIIAPPPDLEPGEGQRFVLETEGVPVGPYFLGLRYLLNGVETRILSTYTVTMSGIPVPVFERPNSNRTVYGDQTVNIRVTIGDQQNAVNWRLFYLDLNANTEGVPSDQLGNEIEVGTRNVVSTFWRVLGVPAGKYKVGISVTDYGQSIAEAVAAGREDRILTVYNEDPDGDPYVVTVSDQPVTSRAPRITITKPDDTEFAGFGVDLVSVEYSAEIFVSEPDNPRVELFYDLDTEINDNEVVFVTTKNIDQTSAVLDTEDLDEDTYFIGGTVYDGVNEPVSAYAAGEVIVTRKAAMKVTEPSVTLSHRPGQEIQIRWKTNLPTTLAARVTVIARRVDADGEPIGGSGSDIVIERITGTAALSRTSSTWVPKSTEKGRFRGVVTIETESSEVGDLECTSKGMIIVSTTPTIWWLGEIEESDDPSFNGAVFQGIQFEDNAGSSIAGGEDFDQDGFDDFVIGARYGKPEFLNPSGKGQGEAYLVRGQRTFYEGRFNLNRVGSDGDGGLRGIVFTGIPTWRDSMTGLPSDDTYGMASVNLVGDMDGDGLGELIFGFPWVINDSDDVLRPLIPGKPKGEPGSGPMGAQLQTGGVVIVSSQNPPVQGSDPLLDEDVVQPDLDVRGIRLRLEQVGQNYAFEGEVAAGDSVARRVIDDVELCRTSGKFGWTLDEFVMVRDGQCLAIDDETGAFPFGDVTRDANFWGCQRLPDPADGVWDVIIQPEWSFGYTYNLALPFSYQENDYSYFGVFADWPCLRRFHEESRDCPRCAGDGSFWSATFIPDAPFYPFDAAVCASCDPVALYESDDLAYSDACSYIPLPGTSDEDSPFVLPPCEGIGSYKEYFESAVGYLIQPDGTDGGPIVRVNRASGLIGLNEPPVWGTGYLRANRVMLEPYGCRILGRPTLVETTACGDGHQYQGLFGASITQSGEEIIVSAPYWTAARATAYAPPPWQHAGNPLVPFDLPESLSIASGTVIDQAGVAYMMTRLNYWYEPDEQVESPARTAPRPCMYMAGGNGLIGRGNPPDDPVPNPVPDDTWGSTDEFQELIHDGTGRYGGLRIIGRTEDRIQNVVGIPDFNDDNRGDVAIGAPRVNSGDGAAYIIFRRAKSVEGDYILDKLALGPSDPERLSGILVNGRPGDTGRLGDGVTGGREFEFAEDAKLFDFDSNGLSDVVVSAPYATDAAGNRVGEVWVIFAQKTLTTPTNGKPVLELLSERRAARIRGVEPDGLFGFTVANIGDIDNDGYDDLAIAAPNAPPRFDPDPNDSNEALTAAGLDRDNDGGVADDVSGSKGDPDENVDANDELRSAGLVYVIFGGFDARNLKKFTTNNTYDVDISKLGTDQLPGFILVGHRGHRWASSPGSGTPTHYGDYLGGGFAGDTNMGGNAAKDHPMPAPCDPARAAPADIGRPLAVAGVGDINGDGRDDFMVGSILADPRVDPDTGFGTVNGGEAYLIYGFKR